MKQQRLNLYTVNLKYIRNLHNQDDHVFSISPQTGKSNRPFVGIVIICDNKQYCVPLSSPKPKHQTMKNDIDFHKILDTNGKLIGVLDFNNMIPVRPDVIDEIKINISHHDSPSVKHYKNLVIEQLTFCRKNQDIIIAKANKLYRIVSKKNVSGHLKQRCLKWHKLEKVLENFHP